MRKIYYSTNNGNVTTSYQKALADGGIRATELIEVYEKPNINESAKAQALRVVLK